MSQSQAIELRGSYVPRAGAQAELHRLMWRKRFAVVICHRRMGKTVAVVNHLLWKVMTCRLPAPRVAYICPSQVQARRVAWLYACRYAAGFGMAFGRPNSSAMEIPCANGGKLALLGVENADSLRGMYLDAVACDEYAQFPRHAWSEVLRPALADRGGSAVLMGTPQGRNELYERYEAARGPLARSSWGAAMYKASETGYIPEAELEAMRAEMSEGAYAQEFECSFDAAIEGAFYGREMANVRTEGRIRSVPFDRDLPVVTAWDLGMRDATGIWYLQAYAGEVRAIACEQWRSTSLQDICAAVLERGRKAGYRYAAHIGPHDLRVRDYGTGLQRLETAERQGIKFEITADVGRSDGIEAVRVMLPRVVFDETGCRDGIEALTLYRADWDGDRRILSREPIHDWTSHLADALRYFAVATDAGRRVPDGRRVSIDWSKRDRETA